MTPKIIFKYSWIYDMHWKGIYKGKSEKYPTAKQIQNYIGKVEKLWRKDENKVLSELSKISGLKWKKKSICCYVVGRCRPFSDPLTLGVYNKADYFVDVLTHELIHQLFVQNENRNEKVWKYFHEKYKSESFNARIHIPVHAIHQHIFLKFFGQKRLKREIKIMSKFPNYKKAWDIVEKEGYENIIKEFKKRVEL
ncbi:hypothetical protein KJ695_04240 [Patescibacteria group bacterium]|nr:hypothetical protein [Patescibacteria group bacterium]MBU4057090.1 hypothetical protein [Patescibacteria group bacterium]MBU4368468.1 hypothetical protein [Patescibacteria group bacterium]